MKRFTDEGLTEILAEWQSTESFSTLPDLTDLSELGLIKATATEEKIPGYITSVATGQGVFRVPYSKPDLQNQAIDVIKDEIIDIADSLELEKDNLIIVGNLIDSLNSNLDKLWILKNSREREFAKFIILIQTITLGKESSDFSKEQIESIATILRVLKSPKIGEIDIKKCTQIIEESGLNIFKTLIKNPKIKIIVQEEE